MLHVLNALSSAPEDASASLSSLLADGWKVLAVSKSGFQRGRMRGVQGGHAREGGIHARLDPGLQLLVPEARGHLRTKGVYEHTPRRRRIHPARPAPSNRVV